MDLAPCHVALGSGMKSTRVRYAAWRCRPAAVYHVILDLFAGDVGWLFKILWPELP